MTQNPDGSYQVAAAEDVRIGLVAIRCQQWTSVTFDGKPDKGRTPGVGDNFVNTMVGSSRTKHILAFGCSFQTGDPDNAVYEISLAGSNGGDFQFVVPKPNSRLTAERELNFIIT